MKEAGILMTPENIQATLEDRKTQTRRVMKTQPFEVNESARLIRLKESDAYMRTFEYYCPYGQVGDRLYIKEPHYLFGHWLPDGITKAGRQKWRFERKGTVQVKYTDNPPPPEYIFPDSHRRSGWYKRSPLFMPKEFARHWLEITNIRAERVQDISEEDAKAEGCLKQELPYDIAPYWQFKDLWNSINAKRGYPWENNDWVWPISYRRIV